MPEILSRDEIERRLTSCEDCPVRLDPVEQGEIQALLTAKKLGEWLDNSTRPLSCEDDIGAWAAAFDAARAWLQGDGKEEM